MLLKELKVGETPVETRFTLTFLISVFKLVWEFRRKNQVSVRPSELPQLGFNLKPQGAT